jgi:hypothetical protein
MVARFQKRCEEGIKGYDPLVLDEFDWNNEWVNASSKQTNEIAGRGGLGIMLTMLLVHQAIFKIVASLGELMVNHCTTQEGCGKWRMKLM